MKKLLVLAVVSLVSFSALARRYDEVVVPAGTMMSARTVSYERGYDYGYRGYNNGCCGCGFFRGGCCY